MDYLDYWYSINGIKQIVELIKKEKYEIRFVGGCIRDALLGNKSLDIDFAVNCDPDTISEILTRNKIDILNYGKKYGTITAVIDKNHFEITSLREDKNQSGRDTEVIFTDSWYKDALRRDFTFNAISIDSNGKIYDYLNGRKDLKAEQVKFIGKIETRIKEDYLRILRYFRFLGLFKNPNLIIGYEEILYNNLVQLKYQVSNDQIRNELLKMLKNKYRINSFINLQNKKEVNILINTINEWWIKDQYELGINKCMNKIYEFIGD